MRHPRYVRIFRAVRGAVDDTAYHHPEYRISGPAAISIAKRATGTLCSQWAAVLAAVPSKKASESRHQMSSLHASGRSRTGKTQRLSLPRRDLCNSVGFLAGEARRSNNVERQKALVDVLRLIDVLSKRNDLY